MHIQLPSFLAFYLSTVRDYLEKQVAKIKFTGKLDFVLPSERKLDNAVALLSWV